MTGRVREGSPEPLGLTLDASGANAAVYSAHASAIELCLFDARGETEIERLRLPCRTGDVHHGHFEGIRAGQRYGLRAYGPYAPREGHCFNPCKLLADPYALLLDRPFSYAPALSGFQPATAPGDARPDTTDSALFVPKAIATERQPAKQAPRARRSWAGSVIYELQVRGFTKLHPDVPEAIRGTFAGLAHPAAIEHLVKLGVTCIEIMPAAAWVCERHLHAMGLTNYWGYNPVTFMAPDPRLAPGGWAEIAASVAAIKAAGIEVILDVVLNHSGEGDELGPTLSLRGLDNATYYRHAFGNPSVLVNDTGCGNTLALDRPPVVRLAMDALRAWAELGGVDGFRFDLATTLGRRDIGFDPAAPLLTAITQDPLLRDLRLIAEPWDIGPGGYRMGAFPAAWGEWNDRFRDSMRRFWRGDAGLAGEAATRFSGSSDIFAPSRPPSRSVNFIVAHDGFTLADLVSYERKHNEANGEQNRDGTDANYSWNNGAEGATADAAILAARLRDQRNLLATLLLARGTPMLTMGAEFGHSQGGNNNAYAQDNAIGWLGWEEADKTLLEFTARLTKFRAAHPVLTGDYFLSGGAVDATLIPDAEWLNADGAPMRPSDWSNPERRAIAVALYAAASTGHAADRLFVVFNAGREAFSAVLPAARPGYCWGHAIDTVREDGDAGGSTYDGGAAVTIAARSVSVLKERPTVSLGVAKKGTGQAGLDSAILDRLARAAGIAPDWYDIAGARYAVPDSTKQALLAGMGLPAGSSAEACESLSRLACEHARRGLPTTLVAYESEPVSLCLIPRDGRTPAGVILQREDGSVEALRLSPCDLQFRDAVALDGRRQKTVEAKLPPQPLGRHRILLENAPDLVCNLTVAPRRCFLPPALTAGKRAFGFAAQLYSVRRPGDQGIGDFTALGQLASLAADAGAATLGLNPLHALFPQDRERASPYYPSDRRFLDPISIDVAALEGGCTGAALSAQGGRLTALQALANVDYAAVWALKRSVLEANFADFNDLCASQPGAAPCRDFEAFAQRGGKSLALFACFEAISEARKGEDWALWPAGLAACEDSAVAAFARENAAPVRFNIYLQWLADKQLREAAARGAGESWLGFYRDLAVGAAPSGAEVWANAGHFLTHASVGAPPDPFAEGGQDWGLKPPNPLAWRASNYRLFTEVLAANMACAGALRIDHAMGLARLFVIPEGAPANEGAYLAFPERDLIGQLALESQRARCLVVGEDLGTVPMHFRATMDAADILSYRVLWFERSGREFTPPAEYPVKSVACVTTHDLPTIAGWWMGEDIREKEALGLIAPEVAEAARKERFAAREALLRAFGIEFELAPDEPQTLPPGLVAAAHKFVCSTASMLAIGQIDDLLGETVSVNLPGTNRERPNWRRKLHGSIADVAKVIADACAARA